MGREGRSVSQLVPLRQPVLAESRRVLEALAVLRADPTLTCARRRAFLLGQKSLRHPTWFLLRDLQHLPVGCSPFVLLHEGGVHIDKDPLLALGDR